jgi:hypothetical protein
MIDEQERQALLDEIEREFGVKLLWFKRITPSRFREDATAHGFFDFDVDLTDDLKRQVRKWVEDKGWQFSRQLIPAPEVEPGRLVEHIYLAPMIHVPLTTGFHATRRCSLKAIRRHGLLPSTRDRQTSENRWDCEGNIYLCEHLGTPTDAEADHALTTHWWCGYFARNNRFNDPDWVILQVTIGKVQGARIYRDIWSKSGVIVDNLENVPPSALDLVYPHVP